MRTVFRRLPFIICVLAAVLVQRNGHPLLFGFSVLIAFANLFSGQLLCALDGCRVDEQEQSRRNPGYLARLVYHVTSVMGFVVLAHTLADAI